MNRLPSSALAFSLCLTGLASMAAAGTLRHAQNLVVVDNIGRRIGPTGADLTDWSNVGPLEKLKMVFAYDTIVFRAIVTVSGFSGDSQTSIFWYPTSDCSGQPYLGYQQSLVRPAVVAPPGQTVYIADRSVPTTTMVLNSYGMPGSCQLAAPITYQMHPVIALVNFLDHFTPPFHYELGCDNPCGYEPVIGNGGTGVIHLGVVEDSEQ